MEKAVSAFKETLLEYEVQTIRDSRIVTSQVSHHSHFTLLVQQQQ
jgi:hypothetical protein